MKEVRSFPTTCQCWHEGDSKSIVVMEGQDWGDTAPLAHLKLWFVTAPKGFCFRESFLLPKLILSLPSAAEVWFSTSLEPGCAAGCWGKPTHVQPNSSCISCVQWKETSASSTHFGAIPYNFSCNLKWEAGRGRSVPLPPALLCRSVQLNVSYRTLVALGEWALLYPLPKGERRGRKNYMASWRCRNSDFLLLVTTTLLFSLRETKPCFSSPFLHSVEGFNAESAEKAVSYKLWALRDPLQSKVWVFLDELKQQVD